MKTVIGIDLGGTNVRVAKITENGEVLQEIKSPSYGMEGPEKVTANIISLVKQIEDYQSCAGIGIGVPGPVDTANRVMKLSSNLKGFVDYPLAQRLEEATGLPTYMDNDANVAGLAEARVGAGKIYPIMYYVTISTGIGGALCVDGKVISGRKGYAGEIGNLIIDPYRAPFNNLNGGASESEASGRALTRKGQEIFGEDKINHAGDVFALYDQKDPEAVKLVDQMTTDLAVLFSHIALVTDPHMFVIGGGMLKSKEYWWDAMIEKFQQRVHAGMRDVIFAEAELSEPGIVGAAMLPLSHGC